MRAGQRQAYADALGRFCINQRFRDGPNGPYRWAAIGILAFSEVLNFGSDSGVAG